MKRFMVALLAVLLVSSAAYAATIDVDGSYYARGRYFKNPQQVLDADQDASNGIQDDLDPYSNYDHELDLWGQINVADTTFVRFRFEIADENWPGDGDTSYNSDDNLQVQRVWGGHTFGTGTKVEFGKMTGGVWATLFRDTADAKYRIKITQPVPVGALLGVIEKNAELGSNIENSEKNDVDTYLLGLVTKAGSVYIKPLLGYAQNGATDLTDDKYNTTTLFYLGLDGDFGSIGFESEFNYLNAKLDETKINNQDSYSLYGAYLDLFAKLDAFKPGLFFAYGSVDKDTGIAFGFGDDFDGHGAEMIGNEFNFGGSDADPTVAQIAGATYLGVYCDIAASAALSFYGQVSYAKANSDLNVTDPNTGATTREDDTAIDISARGAYKITDAVTYTLGFGYVTINKDQGEDPDPGYKLYHKLNIAF